MKYAKITKDRFNLYGVVEHNDERLAILADFLSSDVGCIWSGFKEWVLDEPHIQEIEGNTTILEKDNQNIILSNLFSEQPDGGPYLIIPRDEFVRILDEWEHICKTQPREVLITKDGYKFHVETKE